MYKIVYYIPLESRNKEKEYLNTLKIFPAFAEEINWATLEKKLRVGAIVDEANLLTLKLRRNLHSQVLYFQRQ